MAKEIKVPPLPKPAPEQPAEPSQPWNESKEQPTLYPPDYYPAVDSASEWKIIAEEGSRQWGKSVEHLLAFSYCAFVLKEKCAATQGGTGYTAKVNEYWKLNHDQASKYLAIGKRFDYFNKVINVLPPSYTTLAKLATLTEEELTPLVKQNKIKRGLKGKDAKALVDGVIQKRIKPPSIAPQDAEALREYLDRIYDTLSDSMAATLADTGDAAVQPPSRDILIKSRARMEDGLSNISPAAAKTAMPFILDILYGIDAYVAEGVKASIPAGVKQREKELEEQAAELDAKEKAVLAGIVKVPKKAIKRATADLITEFLSPPDPSPAQLEALADFKRAFEGKRSDAFPWE